MIGGEIVMASERREIEIERERGRVVRKGWRGQWLTFWVISKNKGAWPLEGIEKWSSETNIRDKLKEKQMERSGGRKERRWWCWYIYRRAR